MSRFLKSLSSLMGDPAGRSSDRDTQTGAPETDAGPSTLTTPLFPLNGSDADAPSAQPRPARRHASSSAGAETVPPGALVPLAAQPPTHKVTRKSTPSRALNAVVRATTQVALPTQVDPTPPPKVARAAHRSTVALTETERLRLQIMQVQLKLTGLGLYEGPINGMMNPELVEGVRYFQTLKGMSNSGLLTTGTLTALDIRAID